MKDDDRNTLDRRRFLKVAGDGQFEVHPIMAGPPPEPR